MSSKQDPSAFLAGIKGKDVTVELNSGIEYKGLLKSVDGYMNISLSNTKEIANNKVTKEYGDVFIRGNNVLLISN
ncbi:hypothetical protein CANCADRAFT_21509 [Tortispora caseinolytica NRRL Y-17796]|uniref:Sm domain-containing protein n=1 Tax=Tortispora caseinolytica NRRL Y-17796 TaxID=767744 RepID=A0A1E4TM12_9ASCO|nr:hypothetical protein CANCADRAFT_21509 [Tortispora caseinolytica NRRL Y-17796]